MSRTKSKQPAGQATDDITAWLGAWDQLCTTMYGEPKAKQDRLIAAFLKKPVPIGGHCANKEKNP
jgi:hypothetical protein